MRRFKLKLASPGRGSRSTCRTSKPIIARSLPPQPAGRGLSCANKPNLHRSHAKGKSLIGQRVMVHCTGTGTSAKQSQFRGGAGWGRRLGRRPSVGRCCTNKANLPPPGGTGFEGRGGVGQTCANKANFRQEQQEGQVLCGKGVMVNCTFDRPRQNKANFPAGTRPAGTGAEGMIARNKPNFGKEERQQQPATAYGLRPSAVVRPLCRPSSVRSGLKANREIGVPGRSRPGGLVLRQRLALGFGGPDQGHDAHEVDQAHDDRDAAERQHGAQPAQQQRERCRHVADRVVAETDPRARRRVGKISGK